MDISNNFNFTFNEISNNTIDSLNLFNNNNDISNNVIHNLEQELNEFLDIFGLNIPPVTPPTETIFNDISDVNFFNFFDISRNRRRTRYQPLIFPRRNIRWNTRDNRLIGRRLFSNSNNELNDTSSFFNTRFVNNNGIFNMDNILEQTLLDPKTYKNVLSEEGKNTIKFQTYDISNNTGEICPLERKNKSSFSPFISKPSLICIISL